MKVVITKEWMESIPLEDDMLDPAAGAFRFEPWSVAEPDPEPTASKTARHLNHSGGLPARDWQKVVDDRNLPAE